MSNQSSPQPLLANVAQYFYAGAYAHNAKVTLGATEFNPDATLLDLGCGDGARTMEIAGRIGTRNVSAVEIDTRKSALARGRGIQVVEGDLDKDWHFINDRFDAVHAGFVLEYVNGVDHFLSELHRVLKPGGYALVSTENGSSWHNIWAAVLGWQTFSASGCTLKARGLGNPLSLYLGAGAGSATQTQKVIFNYRGLEEFFWYHGFSRLEIYGSGYYPLPALFGALDPRHAHLLVVKARKV